MIRGNCDTGMLYDFSYASLHFAMTGGHDSFRGTHVILRHNCAITGGIEQRISDGCHVD